ncbi:MAG: ATP-binding protein [Clostridia bacterium]|nr:ATP-binding protein [Clostridia bacterium]
MKKASVVRSVYRSFVLVSILTALTATLGMLIDNIIVGRFLGTNALGAMGVVSPISLIFSAVSNICSGGGTAHAAQALGRGDKKGVANIFTATMLFVLLAGAVLTAVGMAFAPRIAVLLGAKGELLAPTTEYLYGFFLGAIPTIMTSALMGFVKIDGSARLPLVCISVMTLSNIVLDLAMIFVFDLGMFGMALATSIAYCLAVLAGMTHFSQKNCTLKWIRPVKLIREWGVMIVTGAPTALSRICDTVKVMTLNHLLVMAAGTGAVAALNVRTQTYNIVGTLIMGVCQAILPVASVFYGEEDRTALENTLKEALRTGLLLSTAAGLLLVLFPSVLPGLLGVKDAETLCMATRAIRLFAIGMPLQLVNMAMMNTYQATRNPAAATSICILQQLVFTTGFALLLVGFMGSDGVWFAFLLGEGCTLCLIAAAILVRKGGKLRSFSDVLLLKDGFGGDRDDRFEKTLGTTLEEVARVSDELYAFGDKRGLSREMMHRVSLCVEEMAGNVVRHASQPTQTGTLDLLVLNKPVEVMIRIRDNKMMFDPVTYLKKHDSADEHFGIRIVEGVTDCFEYQHTIGLNNVRMVIHKPDESGENRT